MDCIGKLRNSRWEQNVEALVLDTKLLFKPYHALNFERDVTFLKQTSESKGRQEFIEFAQGSYDNFAAVVVRMNHDGTSEIAFATDEYYFARLCLLATIYGRERLYRDCERIYAMTTDMVSMDVLQEIHRMSLEYDENEGLFFNIMLHIYYGMIAEEHYQRIWQGAVTPQRTELGKLMKMHALHRILVEQDDIKAASTECVSMSPKQIREQAEKMGLSRHVTWVAYNTMYDNPSTLPVLTRGMKKQV